MSRSITEAYQEIGGELSRDTRLTQMVLCLFHPDSNPSMKLDVEKNIARCYSCRKSWSPQQMLDQAAGREPEVKKAKEANSVMIDKFEEQILSEIKKSGLHTVQFMKVFEMLDMARESGSIPYEKLAFLLEFTRSRINVGTNLHTID